MIYIGDSNKARKVQAPYIGVGGKSRRVLKGYVGVSDKARLFYDYLDDIDHVEIEFYDLQYYTKHSTNGGTKLADGKAACANYGSSISLSESSGVVTAHLYAKGTTTNYGDSTDKCYGGLYTHFRFWAVLKGGYKLRLDYPKTNDSKAITLSGTIGNFRHTGSYYWYPYVWLLGDTDTFSESISKTATVTLLSGYSGGASMFNWYSGGYAEYDLTFKSPVIGGKTYTLKLKDSIAA